MTPEEYKVYLYGDRPANKPPLGVQPRAMFLEHRINDLTTAIHNNSKDELSKPKPSDRKLSSVILWSLELSDRLVELQEILAGEVT